MSAAEGLARAKSAVRSLVALKEGGSSSRVLNLVKIWEANAGNQAYIDYPMFTHPQLNRAIIVKHRLRASEHDAFPDGRSVGTKVILPINMRDLKAGGWSFFVGQAGYDQIIHNLSPETPVQTRDLAILDFLDTLPSLDPFLLRERLRRGGFNPARCYFEISDADTARMMAFTERELSALIGLSFGDMDVGISEKLAKLARTLLGNGDDNDLEPLRLSLGLDKAQFEEGMFCWRGFLYYKWSLNDLAAQIKPVSDELAAVRPSGPLTDDDKYILSVTRPRLVKAVTRTCGTVRETLQVYDEAYHQFTSNHQPAEFKAFLLRAPGLFQELGERIGAINHLVSFWRYRFPNGLKTRIPAEELMDILRDFEASLDFAAEEARAEA